MESRLVALAAFPKSGVTYLSSLLFYALFPGQRPEDIERNFIVDIHEYRWKEAATYEGLSFAKTHFPFDKNAEIVGRPLKAIYLIRDPIDVMNSAYDFHKLLDHNFEESRRSFAERWIASGGADFDFAGPWGEHVRSWTSQNDIPLCLVRYVDLVDEPRQQLDRIFAFLGLTPDQADITNALVNSSMVAMRAREEKEFRNKNKGIFYRPFLEDSMRDGMRFINRGYRNSIVTLDHALAVAASNRFGKLVSRYLC